MEKPATQVGELYLCSRDSEGEPVLLRNFKGVPISGLCGGYKRAFVLEEDASGNGKIHSLHPPEYDEYDYTFTDKNLHELVSTQADLQSELQSRMKPPPPLEAVKEEMGDGDMAEYEEYHELEPQEGGQELEDEHVAAENATKIYNAFDGKGRIKEIRSGDKHIVLLNSTGGVFSYGYGEYGVLGRGKAVYSPAPEGINNLAGQKIVQVACGLQHCLALNNFGDIYSWGRGFEGQLGLRYLDNEGRPAISPSAPGSSRPAVPLECSSFPRLVKFFTKLRLDKTVKKLRRRQPEVIGTPEAPDVTIGQIACGSYHSLALTKTGDLYGWGDSSCGQLGVGKGKGKSKVWVPTRIPIKEQVTQVAAGFSHTVCVTNEGFVYTFGLNHKYQLGLDDTRARFEPTRVEVDDSLLPMPPVAKVGSGEYNVLALTRTGKIYAWGSGVLGHKTNEPISRPKQIKGAVGDREITDIYVNTGNVMLFCPVKIISVKPSCGPSSGGTVFSILGVGLCDLEGKQRARFEYGHNDSSKLEVSLKYDEGTNSYFGQTPNFEAEGLFDPAMWPCNAKVSVSLDGVKWVPAPNPFFLYSSRTRVSNISPKFASVKGELEMTIELLTDQNTMRHFTSVAVALQASQLDSSKKEESKPPKKEEQRSVNPLDLPQGSPELARPDWTYFQAVVKDKDIVFTVPPHSALNSPALFFNLDVSLNGQQLLGVPASFRYYKIEIESIAPGLTVKVGGTKVEVKGRGFIDSAQKKIKLTNSKAERFIDVKWDKDAEFYYFFTPPITWLTGRDDDLTDAETEELMTEVVQASLTISGKDWIHIGEFKYYEPKLKHLLPGPTPDKTLTEEMIKDAFPKEEPIANPLEGVPDKDLEKKKVELEKKLKEELADIENVFRKAHSYIFVESEHADFVKAAGLQAQYTHKSFEWTGPAFFKNAKRIGLIVPPLDGPPEGVGEVVVKLSFNGQQYGQQGLKFKYFFFNKDTPDIERNKLMDAELKAAKKGGKK